MDKMLENLTAYQPLDISPAPQNLRAMSISPRPNMQLRAQVLVGHDPMTRRITHKYCSARSNARSPQSYELQFPYGVFWFALHGNKLSGVEGDSIVWNPRGWGYVWMKEPYENLDQKCWVPQMPNIFGDSRICFGANSVQGTLPLGHFVDQSVNTFWTSEFNQDLENYFPYNSLTEWADASEHDWRNWATFDDQHGQPLSDKFSRFTEDMQWLDSVPSNTGESIPPLPSYPTFDNLERWMDELTNEQQARVIATAMQQPGEPE
jgi:hypothetical protein